MWVCVWSCVYGMWCMVLLTSVMATAMYSSEISETQRSDHLASSLALCIHHFPIYHFRYVAFSLACGTLIITSAWPAPAC